ncbi:MAG: transglycosylase domain-containing protein, partial [Candidatus Carbobacillus altaicus]|nr:transglycosylase domain-containing protein [Candidatus Carbobacillus altaicus]
MSPAPNKPSGSRRNIQTKTLIIRFMQLFFLLFIAVFSLGVGTAFGFVTAILKDQPVISYKDIKNTLEEMNSYTSFAYFRDGTPIGKLPIEGDRRYVPLDKISPYVIDALISTEDKSFYQHMGVSLKGTGRAVFQLITHSEEQTGGSTITQQLVKQTLLEETYRQEISGKLKGNELRQLQYRRKVNEILLALRIERFLSKQQILEYYLNQMYFGRPQGGGNLYGIEAAARGYFGVHASELNLAQAAYLVGLLQGPANYLPYGDTKEAGLKRMETVLSRMKQDGKIDETEYKTALTFDLLGSIQNAPASESAYRDYPFLMFEIIDRSAEELVRQDLNAQGIDIQDVGQEEYKKLYNELLEKKKRDLLTKGYHIYTTIDKDLYDAFQAFAANPKNFWENPPNYTVTVGSGANKKEIKVTNPVQEVGAVLIDNKTGAILASIGGRDYKREATNHAASPRQPGSTMKTILAYAPAFEEGALISPDAPVDDTPIVLNKGKADEHTPLNYDNKFHGLMSAREALAKSWNVPAVKLSLEVGIPNALAYGQKMGITSFVPADNTAQTAAIGGLTNGVTVYEMTQAYSVFPNGGKLVQSYMIEKITDDEGKTIYQHEPVVTQAISPVTAYFVTDMLKSVMTQGTGSVIRANVEKAHGKRELFGKTGTTSQTKDLWFVGGSPTLTLGLWLGFDIPYTQKSVDGIHKTIWSNLFNIVLDKKPELSPKDAAFPKPDGIVTLNACKYSAKLPSDACSEAGWVVPMQFYKENVPSEADDVVQKARIVIVDGKNYVAIDQTPDDLVIEKFLVKRKPYDLPTKPDPKVNYQPLDWELTYPSELDPRQEDGRSPSAPQGLTAQYDEGTQTVTLTWNKNPETDIAGYRIYRSSLFGMDRVASVMSHLPTSFSEKVKDPTDVYVVTAVDIAGNESPPSSAISIFGQPGEVHKAPSAPKGLKAKMDAFGVTLTWDPNPEREQVKLYHVYYSPDKDGPFEEIGTSDTPYLQILSFGMEDGFFQVTAENALGESEPSKTVQAKPDKPGKPDNPGKPGNGDENGNDQGAIPPDPGVQEPGKGRPGSGQSPGEVLPGVPSVPSLPSDGTP